MPDGLTAKFLLLRGFICLYHHMLLTTITLVFKLLKYLYLPKFYAILSTSWEGKHHLTISLITCAPHISILTSLEGWPKQGQGTGQNPFKSYITNLNIYFWVFVFQCSIVKYRATLTTLSSRATMWLSVPCAILFYCINRTPMLEMLNLRRTQLTDL